MIDFVFLGLVIFAAIYWLAAFASVVLYRRRRPSTSDVAPPVTILKPLRGNDGQLYENLRSFCLQDYRGFEIVFGVRHLHDPAVAVVQRLRHEFPGLELTLVADSRTIGANLKVSNLANLVRHAKHDTLIVADSDMRVGPGYVRAVVGPLEETFVLREGTGEHLGEVATDRGLLRDHQRLAHELAEGSAPGSRLRAGHATRDAAIRRATAASPSSVAVLEASSIRRRARVPEPRAAA